MGGSSQRAARGKQQTTAMPLMFRLAASIAVLAHIAVTQEAASQLSPDQVGAWVASNRHHAVRLLGELAAIRSIASDPAGLAATRRFLTDRLERYGFATTEVSGGGVPALVARKLVNPDAETLLLYFHYDGQEVDPSRWLNDPFVPTLYEPGYRKVGPVSDVAASDRLHTEQRIVARAIADDKGPIAAFLSSLDLLNHYSVEPSINVTLFLEGDEESGSPGLRSILLDPEYQRLLSAAALIILDAPLYQTDEPTIFLGTRGIVTVDLTVYGPVGPLHSGHYGNWAMNPAIELSRLITSMVDETGRVLIEGFYDDRRPLTPEEHRAIDALPPVDDTLRREFGLTRLYGSGQSLPELITYPSLNVRGMQSMYVGNQARTVIPDRATAAIDVRLVPGQSDSVVIALVREHIENQGYLVLEREPTVEDRARSERLARFSRRPGGYSSFRTPVTHPAVVKTIRVIEQATGRPPLILPTIGGSGPLVMFQEILGVPPFGVPLYNHDSNQHSPNENIRLREYFQAIRIIATLLANYGRVDATVP